MFFRDRSKEQMEEPAGYLQKRIKKNRPILLALKEIINLYIKLAVFLNDNIYKSWGGMWKTTDTSFDQDGLHEIEFS